jgi:CHAD domain-containing protein
MPDQLLPPLRLARSWVMNRRVRRLRDGLQTLVTAAAPKPDEVHRLSKHIKKLRSWLHLLGAFKHDESLTSLDRLLKALADSYAGARDTHVMVKSLCRLESACHDAEPASRCREILAGLPQPAMGAVSGKLDKTSILAHLEEGWPTVSTGELSALRMALAKSGQQINKARHSKKVRRGDQAALHRLRKRVKRLDHQLLLAGSDANRGISSRRERLAPVTEALGDLHDLEVLRSWMLPRIQPSGPVTRALVSRLEVLLESETAAVLALADRVLDPGTDILVV